MKIKAWLSDRFITTTNVSGMHTFEDL